MEGKKNRQKLSYFSPALLLSSAKTYKSRHSTNILLFSFLLLQKNVDFLFSLRSLHYWAYQPWHEM